MELGAFEQKESDLPMFEPPLPSAGLNAYTGPWTEAEVAHLLKRTMFGAKKADINYFKVRTMQQSVDELLNINTVPPAPPLKEYTTSTTAAKPDSNIAQGTTWVNDPNNDGTVASQRRGSFKKWWMGQMINQERSILEKMTLFWHNHFSTESNEVGNAQYVYKHHALLRASALGNFKTLTKAITVDPAMLVYLNGQINTATAPDENYGREIQELFCCGKGKDSLYTEGDVKAAAQVLTGWRNNSTTISSYFDAARHNKNNKQFSAFYNNTVITGQSGATAGDLELDAMLDMIFAAQEVAKYVCRRLYRWFVYYDIDDTIEANVITPMANLFRQSKYEVKPVIAALLKSEHFYDTLSRGAQIKSPVDLVVGLFREFEIQFQPSTDYVINYGFYNYLVSWVSNMQQNIGDPPGVSGWSAYYQEPQFHELWINADTLPRRNQFSDVMIGNGYTRNGKKINIDILAFVSSLSDPANPNTLINDSLEILYSIDITQQVRDFLKSILLSGQMSDSYWTDAWITYKANTSNTANRNIVLNRLQAMYKYLMNLPEYQLS
ncbi:MAG TPA: DUF1800 domain-containing protein [Daejeonella sp.]|nr:DUF1800 domain-containing protein [Daejeonella sp.]